MSTISRLRAADESLTSGRGPRRHPRSRFSAGFSVSVSVLTLAFTLGLAARWISPFDPYEQHLGERLARPSRTHPLGTDGLGRDVASRLLWGTRSSLAVALISTAAALPIGSALGLLAAFFGGGYEAVIGSLTDALLAFPALLVALVIVAMVGQGFWQLVIALGIATMPQFIRIMRGEVFSILSREFVEAARAIGADDRRIVLRHILPHTFTPLVVLASLVAARNIVVEASLGFLGLGIQRPTPTWGNVLNDGYQVLRSAPWVSIAPGAAIALVALAFNLIGDALRDRWDPHLG